MRQCLILCLLSLLSFGCVHADQFQLLNYPFQTERDMIGYNYRCEKLLAGLSHENPDPDLQGYLLAATAFTSTDGEYSIVSFSKSPDPALERLRKEFGLSPPPGGAIVRLYRTRDEMPGPIAYMFRDEVVNGVTWAHRFIAVIKDDHSDEQIRNAVSHELVHAFMSSKMGEGFDKLPKWFKEGTALYIPGGKTLYVSENSRGQSSVSWTPQEYNEYRTIFRYLRARLGEQGVIAFVDAVMEKQSVDGPLRSIGIRDEGALKAEALHWDAMRQVKWSGLMVGVVAILLGIIIRAHRRAVLLYDLRLAVMYDNLEAAEDAIGRGASVNAPDRLGRTPLDMAAGNEAMIELLRQHGGRHGGTRPKSRLRGI